MSVGVSGGVYTFVNAGALLLFAPVGILLVYESINLAMEVGS